MRCRESAAVSAGQEHDVVGVRWTARCAGSGKGRARRWPWVGLAVLGAWTARLDAQLPAMWRTSVDELGRELDGDSGRASISGDARFITFLSRATNLVPGDTNGAWDVFVLERLTGRVSRVSVDSAGVQGDLDSGPNTLDSGVVGGVPSISADGRFVAFESLATNLVAGDTNGCRDVFVHDRQTGGTARVSVDSAGAQGDLESGSPRISRDGRFVVFESAATNLVPLDTNGAVDVFLHDRATGQTTRVSVDSAGLQADAESGAPALSADGAHVAFHSRATNLVAGDTNGFRDVFVRDLATAQTVRVSLGAAGQQADSDCGSFGVALSADGARVAFDSDAASLGASWMSRQVFVRDRAAGTTLMASQSSAGVPGNMGSFTPWISPDGRWVAFSSMSYNLVPGNGNLYVEIFLRDTLTGTTTNESYSVGRGFISLGHCFRPSGSDDARFLAFDTSAFNLVPRDTNAVFDVYLQDRTGGSAIVVGYCTPGTSAGGCTPTITTSGTPSASAGSGFTLDVGAAPGQTLGLVFFGVAGPDAAAFGAGTGTLCVLPPLQRTFMRTTGGRAGFCDGRVLLDWNQFLATHPLAVGSPYLGGETVWAQGWVRDASTPGGSVLSDAVWFTVCP